MPQNPSNKSSHIVPRDMRQIFRLKQIEAITAEITKKFAAMISAATSNDQRKELQAKRDAEIANRIDPHLREQENDTPECL